MEGSQRESEHLHWLFCKGAHWYLHRTKNLLSQSESCISVEEVLYAVLFFSASLGVGVLLLHELLSSLQGSSLDVLSSLREEFAEFVQVVVGAAHEDDVWELLGRASFLLFGGVG